MKNMIIICALTTLVFGQTVYELPFASKGNIIELSISNDSRSESFSGDVEVLNAPEFIQFKNKNVAITELSSTNSETALFVFDVLISAAVKQESDIVFTVTGDDGEQWSKTITFVVSPPKEYELFQNYPNPFNPTTTISFLLPEESRVSLKVYNILGEQVSEIMNEIKSPGKHDIVWDASRLASGAYVYLLHTKTYDGKEKYLRKKAMLVK